MESRFHPYFFSPILRLYVKAEIKFKWSLFDVKKYFQLLRLQKALPIRFCTHVPKRGMLKISIRKKMDIFLSTGTEPNRLNGSIGAL